MRLKDLTPAHQDAYLTSGIALDIALERLSEFMTDSHDRVIDEAVQRLKNFSTDERTAILDAIDNQMDEFQASHIRIEDHPGMPDPAAVRTAALDPVIQNQLSFFTTVDRAVTAAGLIQLALRNPTVPANVRVIGQELVDSLEMGVRLHAPALADFIRTGSDPENDMTAEEFDEWINSGF